MKKRMSSMPSETMEILFYFSDHKLTRCTVGGVEHRAEIDQLMRRGLAADVKIWNLTQDPEGRFVPDLFDSATLFVSTCVMTFTPSE